MDGGEDRPAPGLWRRRREDELGSGRRKRRDAGGVPVYALWRRSEGPATVPDRRRAARGSDSPVRPAGWRAPQPNSEGGDWSLRRRDAGRAGERRTGNAHTREMMSARTSGVKREAGKGKGIALVL